MLEEDAKREADYLEQKKKHVSFNEEDIVIRFKKTDILSTVHKSEKNMQVKLINILETVNIEL